MPEIYDVGIIGGGIVGLAGAIYAGRLGLKSVIFADELLGTLATADIVENYPGFKKIGGKELTKKVLEHAKEYNGKIIEKKVDKISKSREGFKLYSEKKSYNVKSIIFATGSSWRKLSVKGEKEFFNKGVHYCVSCDGPLYKNKTVVVVGSGDSAFKAAMMLKHYAKKVYILARKKFHPEKSNLDQTKKDKKIKVYENVEVKEIVGDKFVNKLILTRKIDNKDYLNADGVFVYIGLVPNTKLAKSLGVRLNKRHEIKTDKEMETNVKRVYAAGNCTDLKFKQAITGVGDVVKAVYSAYNDLKHK